MTSDPNDEREGAAPSAVVLALVLAAAFALQQCEPVQRLVDADVPAEDGARR